MLGLQKENSVLLSFVFFLLQVVAFSYSKPSHVWLKNSYRDVVVSLPGDSPETNRLPIVQSILDLFINSSRVLFRATKQRATFGKVNILVPYSWGMPESWLPEAQRNTRIFESNGGFPSFLDADIVLSQNLGVTKKPYVLQDEGCGKTGLRIHVPVEFLLSNRNMSSKSIEFIHCWAQYRYGVFTEGGFQYDSRYPQYYSIPGTTKIEVTECSNVPLTYTSISIFDGASCTLQTDNQTGKPILKECKQTPIVKTGMNTSIMYQQALPHALYFCESDQSPERRHNPNSPSKHNILCSQEGTWPVILRSPDFAFGKNPAIRNEPEKVSFRFVQERNIRIIIAVDVSSHMAKNERYNLIKNAITKFIIQDLPFGVDLGMVFFDEDVKAVKEMTRLPLERAKEKYFHASPFYKDLGSSSNKICLKCGIDLSLQLLRNTSNGLQNGMVILVLSNGSLTTSRNVSDLQALKDDLKSDGIRLSALVFSDGTNGAYEPLEALISASEGLLMQVPEESKMKTLSDLYLSFSRILSGLTPAAAEEHILFVKEIPSAETDVVLNFNVDASAARYLTILITGPEFQIVEPLLIDLKTVLTEPSGYMQIHRKSFYIPAWLYDIPYAETGNYTFKTKWNTNTSRECFIIVSGKPSSLKKKARAIHLKIWTNHYSSMVTKPLKLFTEVKYGNLPIIDAKVKAIIRDPGGVVITSFNLLDNGFGDPDITNRDGIYTRYCDIAKFSYDGYYTVTIEVSDDKSKILYISNDDCCGSFVPSLEKKAIGPFNRTTGLLTFRLSRNQSLNNSTLPSRVLDLMIYKIRQKRRTVVLRWTAAGEHFDHGAASSYRLKLFGDRINAKRRFEETGLVLEYNREIFQFTPPRDYGNLMEYTVQWPEALQTGFHYFAVKAVDVSGRSSDASNVVEAFLQNRLLNDSISCDSRPETDVDATSGTTFCEQLPQVIICLLSRPIINCVLGLS